MLIVEERTITIHDRSDQAVENQRTTLFPEMYENFCIHPSPPQVASGLVDIDLVQIRDFAHDRYRHVDDTPSAAAW